MKPTLFNTDMKSLRFPPPTADEEIRAILANRKTATRRAVKDFSQIYGMDLEITGTIHDNPELLEPTP